MKKEKIIFADPDREYLQFLEGMVVPELGMQAEIILISDFSYFQKYTNLLEEEALLFVWRPWGEELWRQTQNRNLFLIGETQEEERIPVLQKSWDEKKIREKICRELKRVQREKTKETYKTKTMLVYSPIGGSGVSSVAWESAHYLAERGKKVFFLGADTWQDYRRFTAQTLEREAEMFFVSRRPHEFSKWSGWIRHGKIDVLPPFSRSYPCLDISCELFREMEKEIKQTEKYDWIVAETDHAYHKNLTGWMADAEKIMIVIRPGEKWKQMIPVIKNSISIFPREKFCFLYNFCRDIGEQEQQAKHWGWDMQIFLKRHGGTQQEWQEWRKTLGDVLDE